MSLDETAGYVRRVREMAEQQGRDIDVYTVGVVTCRPSAKEAEDYWRHAIVDNADWQAVDNILAMRDITPREPRARRISPVAQSSGKRHGRTADGRRPGQRDRAIGAARRCRPH